MVVGNQRTATELAERVASAKRKQAPDGASALETLLEQKEELLAGVKAGIGAATVLQVCLLHSAC